MAGLEDAAGDAVGAVLFLQAGMYTLDSYSTLLSSPWTAESFGGDPAKTKALKEYLVHASVYSTGMCVAAALLVEPRLRVYPLLGAVLNNAYLIWLYRRASGRAAAAGSASWDAPGGKTTPAAQNMLAWDNPG